MRRIESDRPPGEIIGPAPWSAALILALVVLLATIASRAEAAQDSPQERFGRRSEQAGGIYKDRITPHWFATNAQFWYRNDLPGKSKEFILVNAEKGTRGRAFDHEKLAKALSTASGKEFSGAKLPFETIEFIEEGKAIRFEAAEKTWKCDLNSYECTESTAAPTEKEASAERSSEILTTANASAADDPGPLSPQQSQQT